MASKKRGAAEVAGAAATVADGVLQSAGTVCVVESGSVLQPNGAMVETTTVRKGPAFGYLQVVSVTETSVSTPSSTLLLGTPFKNADGTIATARPILDPRGGLIRNPDGWVLKHRPLPSGAVLIHFADPSKGLNRLNRVN